VILAPRARAAVAWPVPSVELQSVLPSRAAARRSIVRALKLEAEVDAWDRARPEDTLIVDVPRGWVWLHDVKIEMTGNALLFTTLVARATQANRIASKKDLNFALAGPHAASNTASMAKMKAEGVMKEHLLAAGIPAPEVIFRAPKGGYAYDGHAFVGE
jgi:hypothetical protein